MNYTLINNTLTVFPEGRINATNAEAVEAELTEISAANTHAEIILNFEKLDYISSSGLRTVLKLRKSEPTLKITDANPEVYEILDMTGFTELMQIQKAFRRFSVEGCPVIGRGAKGTVYRYNRDTVVKVYEDRNALPLIRRERELARKAFVLGVPTAISYDVVKVGEKYGSVFELLNAKSFSQIIAENPGELMKCAWMSAALLRMVHQTEVGPGDMPDIRLKIEKWLDISRPYLAGKTQERLEEIITGLEDPCTMIHGDFHTNNIMQQGDETLLIDMDTLSRGDPLFELANVRATYVDFAEVDPANVESFLGFSSELALQFWRFFLPAYLETEDEELVEEEDRKIKIFSRLRLMHHLIRRKQGESEEGRAVLDRCSRELEELLEREERELGVRS